MQKYIQIFFLNLSLPLIPMESFVEKLFNKCWQLLMSLISDRHMEMRMATTDQVVNKLNKLDRKWLSSLPVSSHFAPIPISLNCCRFKWSKFSLLIASQFTIFQFSIQNRWRVFCRFSDACTSLPTTGPSLPDGKFSPSLRFTFHASAFCCFTNKLVFHLTGPRFCTLL